MKRKSMLLAGRYQAALRRHIKEGPSASLQPALRLGRQTVVLGLETLELARIHEGALGALGLADGVSDGQKVLLKRAEAFFAEALTPIVETHRAARQSKTDLHRLNETLNCRTLELAATNRQLERGVARRQKVEAALKASGVHYARLLQDSLKLQQGLRQLTHQLLASQEEERKQISLELQNEVAQTLLGINVRLTALKHEAKSNSKGLKEEIASTKRLVANSARSIQRVAREFRNT
jgi:signal transduction histidine kinase